MKKSIIDNKTIEFRDWLKIKSNIKSVYTGEVVPIGTSAKINSKKEFLDHQVIVIVLPKNEKLVYLKK